MESISCKHSSPSTRHPSPGMIRRFMALVPKHVICTVLSVAVVGFLAVSGAQAAITWSGEHYTDGGDVRVGENGTGSLTINDGSDFVVSAALYAGMNGNGTVNVDGIGSSLSSQHFYLGSWHYGYLNITGGATYTVSGNSWIADNGGAGVFIDVIKVNGSGSTFTGGGWLSLGYPGKYGGASITSINDGGTMAGGTTGGTAVQVGRYSTLYIDLGRGSSLTAGGGSGTFYREGTVRLTAGAATAAGTYSPISAGTWTGSGAVQALGGVWNSTAHTVTVSSVATGAAGVPINIDRSTTQRVLVNDVATGKSVGASFMAATSSTNLTLTATPISGTELTSLQSLLAPGQGVMSGWDFSTSGYTAGNPVYLSLFAGSGHSLSDLDIWHFDGSAWTPYATNDLAYDNTYASFTVTGFSGYAVSGTAPVPIPPAFLLFGSGLIGLVGIRRFKK